ncbi:hypothetical protein ACKWTF_015399 [Chironomus riparius]
MFKVFVICGIFMAVAGQIQPNFPNFPQAVPNPPPMEPMAPNFPIFPPVNAPSGMLTSRPQEQWPPVFPNSPTSAPGNNWFPTNPPAFTNAPNINWFPTNSPSGQKPPIDIWPPMFPTDAPVIHTTAQPDNNGWHQVITTLPQIPPVRSTTKAPFTTVIQTRPTVPIITRPPITRPPTIATRPPTIATRPPIMTRTPPPNNNNNNNNNINPIIKPINTIWGTARYDSRCPMGMSAHPVYIPDSMNCRKFYMCNYGIAWLMSCPPSVTGRVIWSQEDNACREVEDPRC